MNGTDDSTRKYTEMDAKGDLEPLAIDLAKARKVLAEAKVAHDEAKRAYEESQSAVIAAYNAARKAEVDAKNALAGAAEVYYEASGDKEPILGVDIKLVEEPVFAVDVARDWAYKNMPALLVLDEKAYAKMLREVSASDTLNRLILMPGAMVTTAKAYIASDLSEYLEEHGGR